MREQRRATYSGMAFQNFVTLETNLFPFQTVDDQFKTAVAPLCESIAMRNKLEAALVNCFVFFDYIQKNNYYTFDYIRKKDLSRGNSG